MRVGKQLLMRQLASSRAALITILKQSKQRTNQYHIPTSYFIRLLLNGLSRLIRYF